MRTIYQLAFDGEATSSRTIEDTDGVPPGWVVAGDPPTPGDGERVVWGDGAWVIAPAAPPAFTGLEARRAAVCGQIDAMTDAIFQGGYAPTDPAFAGQTLQLRNNTDRTNWLTSQASYSAAVSAGDGATEGAVFRTTDNATITVSYADGLAVLLAMAAWGASVYLAAWALKDAVNASSDPEKVDLTAGWPA